MSEVEKQPEGDSEEQKKSKSKRRTRSLILYFLILIMLKDNTAVRIAAPFLVPFVLEERYKEPFEYIESTGGNIILSPISDSSIHVTVRIKSKWLVWAAFEDDYNLRIISKYTDDWLKNNYQSKYSKLIFTFGNYNGVNPNDFGMRYSIQELKKGPEFAQNAYETVAFRVHCYCSPNNREEVQKELFELYKRMGEDFDLNNVSVGMIVADEDIYENMPELKEMYTKSEFTKIGSNKITTKNNIGKFWGFESYKKEGTDIERALNDYDYFLSCITVISPGFYKMAETKDY